MKIIIVLCIVLAIAISPARCQRYDGYKLYRVAFERGQEERLRAIIDGIEGTDIWLFSMATGTADVWTPPAVEKQLLSALKENGFTSSLQNDDLQSLMDETEVVKYKYRINS